MAVYSYSTKRWERNGDRLYRGVVYIDSTHYELGYFDIDENCVPIYLQDINKTYLINRECCHVPLYFHNPTGYYVIDKGAANNSKYTSKNVFPYPIMRCYNFSKHNITPSKEPYVIDEDYLNIRDYTLGFEFETCNGNVPWLLLRSHNLVPLYDGSIKGHEYVTFPLNALQLSNIEKYLDIISIYCSYDKDCSLHIHYGGYPVDYKSIQHLVSCWSVFQNELLNYLPPYSYKVELYKSNGKSYNKPMSDYRLSLFYESATGNSFIDDDSFYLPNRYDDTEDHKWQVHGRYYNMNIMHLISGNKHKTVEFRFLRPTKCYQELKWYILVLGAFLNYSKDLSLSSLKCTLENVLVSQFPEDLANKLIEASKTLYKLHKIQSNCDRPGVVDKLKNTVFNICPIKI